MEVVAVESVDGREGQSRRGEWGWKERGMKGREERRNERGREE